jgi:hypothetical protein
MTATNQEQITVIAPVAAGQLADLEAALERAGQDPATGLIPFGKIPGVHFARLVVIPAFEPAVGPAGPAWLVLLMDCDAPKRGRLRQLVSLSAAGLDDVYRWCEGYPAEGARTPAARYAYLRDHQAPTAAVYVNTIGRTVNQIRAEAGLREEIEEFLDTRSDWSAMSATGVRSEIQQFLSGRQDLAWALRPEAKASLRWRVGNKLNLIAGSAVLIALAPVAILGAIPYAIQLRRLERSDPAPRITPDEEHSRRLGEIEDLVSQNQFTAFGELKDGAFRKYTAIVLLKLINFVARHRFAHGNLAGVKTIHAARWVFLDDRRRVVFISNYDGSLENYMDDFIDKVAWGLNAVFSNGKGYPRTRWLIKGGAKDELAFKSYIRAHQVPSQVWYTAYPDLTALNIENNARIRAGLSGDLDEAAAAQWLKRF